MPSKKPLIFAFTLAMFSGVLANPAYADCQVMVEPAQSEWLIHYNPITEDEASRSFDLAITNTGDAPCMGQLQINLRGEAFGLGHNGVGDRVPYALIDEANGADLTPRTGQNARRINNRPVHLAPGERGLYRFNFAATTPDSLNEGLYSQEVFVAIENNDGHTLSERPLTLGVQVPAAALMGLKGRFSRSNGVAYIDLGELNEGVRDLGTSLFVLSTRGYRVSVTSENAGKLRLGVSDWYVAYDLNVGTQVMDTDGGGTFDVVSTRSRADSYPLSVNIKDVKGKRAGDYSDILTFTIAAL